MDAHKRKTSEMEIATALWLPLSTPEPWKSTATSGVAEALEVQSKKPS